MDRALLLVAEHVRQLHVQGVDLLLGGQRPGRGGEQGVGGSDAIPLDHHQAGLDRLGQHVLTGQPA